MTKHIDDLCVNTIRALSMDAVEKANSGHPGMPMGMADVAYVLWTKFLRHNPNNPTWFNRDRFILSAGHGSMLLYSLLHLSGYDVTLDDLKNFRQWKSITPGHPEVGHTPGVETTTGPLGQGFGNGIGMALAEAHLTECFNNLELNIIDHYIYAIVSDGDIMEGVSQEAASIAGHLKLGKLIYLYDDNEITIDGSTENTFTEDVLKRFEAYGWHVSRVDGHNRTEIELAIKNAKNVTDKPSLISCKTKIGFGSPNKEGRSSSHGAPLGEEEIKLTKQALGLDPTLSFHVPDQVYAQFRSALHNGKEYEAEWNFAMNRYKEEYPEDFSRFKTYQEQNLSNLESLLPEFVADIKGMASRKASGNVLNAIATQYRFMIGGSADLAGSNNSTLDGESFIKPGDFSGRNIHFGIREHAMASIANGICLHGGLRPFIATFLVFSDYCRPAIRMAGLSKLNPIYIFTHDSIGLGEDGPTHQPVEHLLALRSIPNVTLIRPADANETAYAWKSALENTNGPTLLILTRQNLPTIDRNDYSSAKGVEKGAYTVLDNSASKPDIILIGTGSELQYAIEAQRILKQAHSITSRVVSMPSWELFRKQDKSYRDSVLQPDVKKRISIEAGVTMGWREWIGDEGITIGLDRFGASAPYEKLYKEFGLSPENVIAKALELVGK